ncbi:hypothetical protein THZG08_30158 [Vibrio owensii]|nr:hypothetical protein THZG08_30158 [Vibrio owensii]CAH1568786.1 hypothetical protein THOA03_30157 [Vibrio owensii]
MLINGFMSINIIYRVDYKWYSGMFGVNDFCLFQRFPK